MFNSLSYFLAGVFTCLILLSMFNLAFEWARSLFRTTKTNTICASDVLHIDVGVPPVLEPVSLAELTDLEIQYGVTLTEAEARQILRNRCGCC